MFKQSANAMSFLVCFGVALSSAGALAVEVVNEDETSHAVIILDDSGERTLTLDGGEDVSACEIGRAHV